MIKGAYLAWAKQKQLRKNIIDNRDLHLARNCDSATEVFANLACSFPLNTGHFNFWLRFCIHTISPKGSLFILISFLIWENPEIRLEYQVRQFKSRGTEGLFYHSVVNLKIFILTISVFQWGVNFYYILIDKNAKKLRDLDYNMSY